MLTRFKIEIESRIKYTEYKRKRQHSIVEFLSRDENSEIFMVDDTLDMYQKGIIQSRIEFKKSLSIISDFETLFVIKEDYDRRASVAIVIIRERIYNAIFS